MRVILLIIILSCVFTSGRGQFTYFNQTAGGVSDSLIDSYTNVEVLGDTLYIYGGIDDDAGDMRLLLRKYNVQGQQVGESEIEMPFGTVFMETTASFVKSQDDLGFHITISVLDSVVSGWVCSLTTQFDTLWTNRYDQWSPFTSFRRNIDVGDGIVMAGENQPPGTQRGTILTKIDNEGELVWSTELQHTPGVNIRLSDIEYIEDYLVAGGFRKALGQNTPAKGMFTKCDPDTGEPLWEYIDSDYELGMTAYDICQTTTGKVLAAATVQYEYAPPSELSFWTKLRVLELDVENEVISQISEYFYDYEMDNGFLEKIIPTDDGGVLLLGQKNAVDMFEYKVFLFKLDSLGNEQWFNYYAYEYGNNHLNDPFDVEQTSDGGYIVAGQYSNWNVSIGQRGWLLKVDACGDVEWQGCELPDGLWEHRSNDELRIYPNPAQDYVFIDSQNLRYGSAVQVFDQLGRIVISTSYQQDSPINLSHLDTGVYVIMIESMSQLRTSVLSIHR